MSAFRHYSSRARPYKLSAGNSTAPLALALVADLVELGAFGALAGSGANGVPEADVAGMLNSVGSGNGQAEERLQAARGPTLRPRSHHCVRALVPAVQAQSARPGGDDGGARRVNRTYDYHALGCSAMHRSSRTA